MIQLENDGFAISSYTRTTGDGYYESVILDQDRSRIELVAFSNYVVKEFAKM